MSFQRLIFYSAVIGGWAAFVGWLIAEVVLLHRARADRQATVLTAAIVGACIAGALNILAGINGGWQQQLPRAFIGLAGGFIGGAVGGFLGDLIASVTQALGWAVMGLAIGSVDGLYERSSKKLRNGLIGGGLGGLIGGLLFQPVYNWIGSNMSSRATGFVILGIFIGLLIGLAQVILKEAWLTVIQGFRPGRQLILTAAETWLGTSEKAQLPFIAFGAKGVEPIHLRILHQPDGTFVLQDNNTRTGTQVNGVPVQGPTLLRDGDLIQLGPNAVRFSESYRHVEKEERVLVGAAKPLASGEAIAVALPVSPPSPGMFGSGGMPRPQARPISPAGLPPSRPATGIPVGRPAPAPVRNDNPVHRQPPQVPPRGSPAPNRPAPPPASPPPAAPPVQPPNAADSNACPICARPAKGPLGKRLCENCGIKF